MKLKISVIATLITSIAIAQGSLDRFTVPQNNMNTSASNSLAADKVFKYDEVDLYPYYEEGIKEFYKLFNRKLWVPNGIREQANLITIRILFIIERNGEVSNIKCNINSLVPEKFNGLREEIVKAMKKMPDWIPGKVNGEVVRTKITIPYSLTINTHDREEKKEFRTARQ